MSELPDIASPDEVAVALRAFFAARDDVAVAWLFGSVAAGNTWKGSDVDVAVLPAEADVDPIPRAELCSDIAMRLSGALGVERVDVVALQDASALLGGRIVTRGRRVFDRDPRRATEAEIRALTAYWDFAPVLEMKHRALAERMGEYADV